MRYFSWFVLLLSFALFEMGCNNGAPGQASNELESAASDTLCAADFTTVADSTAENDSADYAAFIDEITIPAGYNITNPRVTHFVVPIHHINTLIKWKAEGKIMPNPSGNDSTWTMLALEPSSSDSLTIVPYFACYTSLGEGKKGPIVYLKLPERGSIDSIPHTAAEANIEQMKKYLRQLTKGQRLFYPYGFQFPWDDLVGLSCSLQGTDPNNSLHGVLVIKDGEVKGRAIKEVDYYLHSFYKRRFTRLNKSMPGDDDDDEYFDFTNPCPTSCIP